MARLELLFRVKAEGREYKIYTTREVEGFGPNARVFNRYPILPAKEIREHLDGQLATSSQPASAVNMPCRQSSE